MRGAYGVVVEVLRAVPRGSVVLEGVAAGLQVDDSTAADGGHLEGVLGLLVVVHARGAAAAATFSAARAGSDAAEPRDEVLHRILRRGRGSREVVPNVVHAVGSTADHEVVTSVLHVLAPRAKLRPQGRDAARARVVQHEGALLHAPVGGDDVHRHRRLTLERPFVRSATHLGRFSRWARDEMRVAGQGWRTFCRCRTARGPAANIDTRPAMRASKPTGVRFRALGIETRILDQ